MRSEGLSLNEKSTDTSWDRTTGLPIYSTAPVLPRSPYVHLVGIFKEASTRMHGTDNFKIRNEFYKVTRVKLVTSGV